MADTIADVDAVFAWLQRRGVQRQDIVLYGQSLGSGPTLNLAAREKSIAGVVLHAAFASGARTCRHPPRIVQDMQVLQTKVPFFPGSSESADEGPESIWISSIMAAWKCGKLKLLLRCFSFAAF